MKVKLIITVILLVVVIVAAFILYDVLSRRNPADSPMAGLPETGQENVQESAQSPPEENQGEGDIEEEDDRVSAPDFRVQDLQGNEVRLSDFIGKPVVLNFWTSWCSSCREGMPAFDTVYADMNQDVAFMMVSIVDDARETVESATTYIEESGYSFPVYLDTTREAAAAYGILSIPTTFLIGSDGYIVFRAVGVLEEDDLRAGIDFILNN